MEDNIGVDLGTSNTVVYHEGRGVVLNEPTIVALDAKDGTIIAMGQKAYDMLGKAPGSINVVKPLLGGVIAHDEITRELMKHYISKVNASQFVKPRVAVCVPAKITGIEQEAIIDAARYAGARQVFLTEEPIAAALGAGLDIFAARGHLIVDIGGGTTDIAVLSMGGKVQSTSIKYAGNALDQAIIKQIQTGKGVLIGEQMAEKIKAAVVALPVEECDIRRTQAKGRNLISGLPESVEVDTTYFYDVAAQFADIVVAAIISVLERTPPELAGDIFENGIVLTGGGAKLRGIAEYLHSKVQFDVRVADNPELCVAIGTGMSLSLHDKLEAGFERASYEISEL